MKFSTQIGFTICRFYSKETPKNLKGKKHSSQLWITRQLSDPFVEKAKMMNYRCRSAFKLLQIDDRYKIFKPGQIIVDCGAAPGSWCQIAAKRSNSDKSMEEKPHGIVIGIDKLQIYPIEGVNLLGNMDFTTVESQQKIKTILNDRKADVVLSDMAPNATGVRSMDQENIINLAYSALTFAVQISEENASLLLKVWDGGEVSTLEKDVLKFYKTLKIIKPLASRSESSEKFLLGRGFRGIVR